MTKIKPDDGMKPEELIGKRNHKYRTWCKDTKEMSYNLDLLITNYRPNHLGIKMFENADVTWKWGFKDIWFCDSRCGHLMQYLGIKDKNGKEIYEGDIMENKEIITFSINSLDCANGFYSGFGCGWHNPEELKIIGNIFENKDLLKRPFKMNKTKTADGWRVKVRDWWYALNENPELSEHRRVELENIFREEIEKAEKRGR